MENPVRAHTCNNNCKVCFKAGTPRPDFEAIFAYNKWNDTTHEADMTTHWFHQGVIR